MPGDQHLKVSSPLAVWRVPIIDLTFLCRTSSSRPRCRTLSWATLRPSRRLPSGTAPSACWSGRRRRRRWKRRALRRPRSLRDRRLTSRRIRPASTSRWARVAGPTSARSSRSPRSRPDHACRSPNHRRSGSSTSHPTRQHGAHRAISLATARLRNASTSTRRPIAKSRSRYDLAVTKVAAGY